MESKWRIRCINEMIIVHNRCNVHHDIEYKNLKKLESHLIDVYPNRRFDLDYVYPELKIIGHVNVGDVDTIKTIIAKNRFCRPKTKYLSRTPGSPDIIGRHWEITKPEIIFQRRITNI